MSRLFEIEGFDQFQKAVQDLPQRQKRTEILKLLRRVAKPMRTAARNAAPVVDPKRLPRYRYTKGGGKVPIPPMNLKKSIGIFNGKSKTYPNVLVGPRTRGTKYLGYYAAWLEYGTVNMPAQPFMEPAFNQVKSQSIALAEKEVAAHMQKMIDKHIHK